MIWAPKVCILDKNISFPEGMKVLDVGCGEYKISGAVGLDNQTFPDKPGHNVDVVHDLNKTPWPFKDETFDLVVSTHCIEHLEYVPSVMNEIHRIAKKGGRIVIQVPYFRSVLAFSDPTHRNFFAVHSFESNAKFKIVKMWLGSVSKTSPIRDFIHKYPDFYERFLSKFYAFTCITWEFEVR